MPYAVRFEEVTKRYPRGGPGYVSLRSDLAARARRLAGAVRRRPQAPTGTLALTDISFEVEEGESYAIVGPNGAGKTTALKLVSRISYPTSGRVRVRGRVGALIEVGSGIHPELTGRENIMLYGQILGMSRQDIHRRFEQIVEFAELSTVLDRQVKLYSSGMQLRLGFAIAAHLDPDLFVVDEALAVGDAGFQTKCIERMVGLVNEGKTLVFVSHTLPVVREVCQRGLLLEDGRIVMMGTAEEVVDTYLHRVANKISDTRRLDDPIEVKGIKVVSERSGGGRIATHDAVRFEIDLFVQRDLPDAMLGVGLTDGRMNNLVTMTMLSTGRTVTLTEGHHRLTCTVPDLSLLPANYEILFAANSKHRAVNYAQPQVIGVLVVSEGPEDRKGDLFFGQMGGFGPLAVDFDLQVRQIESGGTTVGETS